VDCNKTNGGCDGGNQDLAFKWAKKNYATLEADYKYKDKDGDCKYDQKPHTKVLVTDYAFVTPNSPAQMKAALALTTLSVSVDATGPKFMNYESGIFDHVPYITRLDHAVLLVGWGTENGTDYWIMKNSFST
jgi:hypothetical protein